MKNRPRQKRLLCLQSSIAKAAVALSLALSHPRGSHAEARLHLLGSAHHCALASPPMSRQHGFSLCHSKRSSSTLSSTRSHAEEPASHQHYQHPSQPVPDMLSPRRPPLFPGAIPINPADIATCINQTGQSSPTNALLGKPSQCQCRHGFAQAFSLDPMPPAQKIKRRKMDRLNSGLLKLTCPLLVSSVDILEDDGFMKEINSKLVEREGEENEWKICMDNAHRIHASTRQELIFEEKVGDNDKNKESSSGIQILQSKLGERGAESFLKAGVAGANPSAKTVDVKCLHAWLADYLFAISTQSDNTDSLTTKHPIGDTIVEALKQKGVDISGTGTCHEVCSGCSRSSTSSSDESIAVHVPIPRNKQRRKRRQLEKYDSLRDN